MKRLGRYVIFGTVLVIHSAMSGCTSAPTPLPAAPEGIETLGEKQGENQFEVTPTAPISKASRDLAAYYARLETSLTARGLLRTDGGGIDTPFDIDDIQTNFTRIAFFDEFKYGQGFVAADDTAQGLLSKWTRPVRIGLSFGSSVPETVKTQDTPLVQSYVERLARLTRHPISLSTRNVNFDVMLAGLDDARDIDQLLAKRGSVIRNETQRILKQMPKDVHCLVFSFSDPQQNNQITYAFALIRAEHPDLMRTSCYHEEIAQGLGLSNDSPRARPSIFNDDEEFATLTTHDQVLLQMLYDPRLKSGMSLDTATPWIIEIATELNQPNS